MTNNDPILDTNFMPTASTAPNTKGRRFSDTQREEIMAKVAQMDRRGYHQWDIAWALGVSQPMVGQYLKRIRERYKQEQFGSREQLLSEKIHQYREVRREAWEAWEESRKDREKTTTETTDNDRGSATKVKEEKEGRLPASEYLRLYQDALKAERELLGIDPEAPAPGTEVNVNVGVNVNIWDALSQVSQSLEVVDEVEQRLLEALEQPLAVEGGPNGEEAACYGLKELKGTEASVTAASDNEDAANANGRRDRSDEGGGKDGN